MVAELALLIPTQAALLPVRAKIALPLFRHPSPCAGEPKRPRPSLRPTPVLHAHELQVRLLVQGHPEGPPPGSRLSVQSPFTRTVLT